MGQVIEGRFGAKPQEPKDVVEQYEFTGEQALIMMAGINNDTRVAFTGPQALSLLMGVIKLGASRKWIEAAIPRIAEARKILVEMRAAMPEEQTEVLRNYQDRIDVIDRLFKLAETL